MASGGKERASFPVPCQFLPHACGGCIARMRHWYNYRQETYHIHHAGIHDGSAMHLRIHLIQVAIPVDAQHVVIRVGNGKRIFFSPRRDIFTLRAVLCTAPQSLWLTTIFHDQRVHANSIAFRGRKREITKLWGY
ncbi:no significant blast hit [Histoplasma capsulatum var. duboisii H88]|uniref:No significant blast hit n=1 Tax=Ajellomyces capsulatus (strain H88) TaxID=544711 RepID=A0A8A1LS19_AJEC8|nr:no significant blast hit [Histoplasma capsulatum var. duboisii H88]